MLEEVSTEPSVPVVMVVLPALALIQVILGESRTMLQAVGSDMGPGMAAVDHYGTCGHCQHGQVVPEVGAELELKL